MCATIETHTRTDCYQISFFHAAHSDSQHLHLLNLFCEFNWDRRGGGGRGASRGKQEGANLDERHGRQAPSIRRAHKPAFVQ